MCEAHILAKPDFIKTFIMECDALENGIRVLLMQEGHPLSFTSHPIKGKNLKIPFTRRKCLQYYMPWSNGTPTLWGDIKIKTDHDGLKYFL